MFELVLGLLAGGFYGAADFCGGLATKRTSIFAVTVVSQAAGFVLLAAIAWLLPFHATIADYGWGLAAGACGAIGIALLYHALSIGKMGVVSPITAVLGAALPAVVGIVIRHERISSLQLGGIVVALLAVVLISLSHDENGRIEVSTVGVKEAILSGLGIGGFFVFLTLAHPAAGLQPLLAARLCSVVLLVVVVLIGRRSIVPGNGTLGLIVFAGAIDATANVLYILATHVGTLAIAAVLTSLYPASTVFLARIVLKERLAPIQNVGLAIALAGVALIAL